MLSLICGCIIILLLISFLIWQKLKDIDSSLDRLYELIEDYIDFEIKNNRNNK